jgi:hypothetical protein
MLTCSTYIDMYHIFLVVVPIQIIEFSAIKKKVNPTCIEISKASE